MSESEATGKLANIPGMVEADATRPIQPSGVPRFEAKGFNTGFFDIVELEIANNPMIQSVQKTLSLALLTSVTISKPC